MGTVPGFCIVKSVSVLSVDQASSMLILILGIILE